MTTRIHHFCVATILVFMACAAAPAAEPVGETPQQQSKKRIAVIAIHDPEEIIVENRGGPLALLGPVGAITDETIMTLRSAELAILLRKNGVYPGEEMTAAIVDQLTSAGYSVDLIKDGERVEGEPDEIDLSKLKTDATSILLVELDEFGMYSGFRSTKFIPRVNIEIDWLHKHDLSEIHSQSIYYGVDASKASSDEIPSDPKYAFASFQDVLNRQAEVIEAFRIGFQQISSLLVEQINSRAP